MRAQITHSTWVKRGDFVSVLNEPDFYRILRGLKQQIDNLQSQIDSNVSSDSGSGGGGGGSANIRVLTRAEYDEVSESGSLDSETFYLLIDEDAFA